MSLSTPVHVVRSFLSVELRNIRQFDLPWQRRFWLYRNGYLSSKDAIWDLSEETTGQYLSDRQGLDSKLRRVDSPYDSCLDDKLLFPLVVSRTHGELLPDVYGVVDDDGVVSTDRLGTLGSFDELVDVLRERRVVAKPPTTEQGDGVRVLDGRDGRLRVNRREVSRDELVAELRDGRELVLQEYVSQADYADAVYPHATNTVRFITMVDPDTREPFVAAVMHRFGTADSGTIDNASAGGISAGIDGETGELAEALVPPGADESAGSWTETHPDTGARIAGTVIPEWDRVKGQLLDLAAEYGWLWPLVAWDVVVTDDQGTIAVIEGNGNPGTKFIQAHQPLLADARVRRFFRHHDVL